MCNGTDPSPSRLITGGAVAILHPPRRNSSSSDSSTSSISSLSSASSDHSESTSTHSAPYALHLQNPTAQGYTQATLSTVDVTGHPLATLGLRRGSFETHRELEGLKRCRLVIQYVYVVSCAAVSDARLIGLSRHTGDLTITSSPLPHTPTGPLHTIDLATSTLSPPSQVGAAPDRIELTLHMQQELELSVGSKGVIGRKVQLVEVLEDGDDGEDGLGRVLREGVLGWN